MRSLLGIDSPSAQFLEKVVNMVLLNLLTICCALPIVTLGASMMALYHTQRKVRQDQSALFHSFFVSFKENFFQATALWMLLLASGILCGFAIIFYIISGKYLLVTCVLVPGLMILMITTWVFPIQAWFYSRIGATLKNAFLCNVAYLPRTVLMMVSNMLPVVFTLLVFRIPLLLLACALVWFSLVADINIRILEKPFAAMSIPGSEQLQSCEN